MSYNSIYGKGITPGEALLYSKINEIGHNTKPIFLKKTKIKYLDYTNNNLLETHLFIGNRHNIVDRNFTISEININRQLIEYYGVKELNNIYNIYNNPKSNITICLLISKCNTYNLYKFIY